MAQGFGGWGLLTPIADGNVSTEPVFPRNNSDSQGRAGTQLTGLDLWILEGVWFLYCCLGEWTLQQPLRFLAVVLGILRCIMTNVLYPKKGVTLAFFMTYLLGRIRLAQGVIHQVLSVAIVLWMVTDTVAIFLKAAEWVGLALEAVAVITMLGYHLILAMSLQPRGRAVWMHRVCTAVGWGLGWGALAAVYWLVHECTILIMTWFMLYAALFPTERAHSPGSAQPPVLQSPWLNPLTRRRQREEN